MPNGDKTDTKTKLIGIKPPIVEDTGKTLRSGLISPDEETGRALDIIARLALDFPRDKVWSWTRLKPWEINLIAAELTRLAALDPKLRPKDKDGKPMLLAYVYLEWVAYLRLAEKGALRGEAKDMFQAKSQSEAATGGGWGSDLK